MDTSALLTLILEAAEKNKIPVTKYWPKNVQVLSRHIRKVKPNLQKLGYSVTFGRVTAGPLKGRTQVTVTHSGKDNGEASEGSDANVLRTGKSKALESYSDNAESQEQNIENSSRNTLKVNSKNASLASPNEGDSNAS